MKADYPYAPRPFAPQVIEGCSRPSIVRRIATRIATPAGILGLALGYVLGRWL
jgi:hypothetical protein